MTFTIEVNENILTPSLTHVYPYGASFFKYQCQRYNLLNEFDNDESEDEKEELSESDIKIDIKYIKSLESKDWKEQDHYRVLGIPHLRVKASTKDVKKAYKFMVLKCHPDKSQGSTKVNEEAFTCIQRSYEQLYTLEGKRAYDSVDPQFDDDVPNITEHSKQNFFKIFGLIFASNSQWSMQKNVPALGSDSDSIDDVNDFYNYWYDFKSWREYSYLDEEERDKAENKDERRYYDKINKQERVRRKKEEVSRIRTLVDNAYACDPRIKAFNEERKKRKQEAKLAKQEAYRLEQEALLLQKEEEERIKREEEEKRLQEEKEKAEAEKKERQKQNKVLKTERKKVREHVKKYNYFCSEEDNVVKAMENLDLLLGGLSLEKMKNLNSISEDKNEFSVLYRNYMTSHLEDQENKKKESLVKAKQSQDMHKDQDIMNSTEKFTPTDIALLVKAVKIYPPGTVNRWNTIADYLNQHSNMCNSYINKDIIEKVKKLQSREGDDLKSKINEQAYENFEKSQKQRIDEVTATGGLSTRDTLNSALNDPKPDAKKKKMPWSGEEQKLLEEGLKKFPQSVGPQRWDSIANKVGTRSKKECMRRYKDLVEQIKAKRAK